VINFLKETEDVLIKHRHYAEQVNWIGTQDGLYVMNWREFAKLAEKVDYDNGPGNTRIPIDLVVVGKDWWLTRTTDDGAEQWVHHQVPQRSWTPKTITKVVHDLTWMPSTSVKEIN
jgi:hypothetical protein